MRRIRCGLVLIVSISGERERGRAQLSHREEDAQGNAAVVWHGRGPFGRGSPSRAGGDAKTIKPVGTKSAAAQLLRATPTTRPWRGTPALLTVGPTPLLGGDRGQPPFAGHALEFVHAAVVKPKP